MAADSGCTCGNGATAHGPPIVFVHGWSQSQLCWARQTSGPLAEDFTARHLRPPRPRHVREAARRRPYVDAQLWADDLDAVIEQLLLDRPVLVAWSYGGFVVSDYLRAYGEADDRRHQPRRRPR